MHTTDGEWVGGDVCDTLTGAAEQLGFTPEGHPPMWHDVVAAIAAGCLPDLLSEAIEAAEALFGGEQEQAEAEAAE
jgi:hypothetical protein